MPDILNQTVNFRINDDVIDIPSMRSLNPDQYLAYVDQSLFWMDHHEVLRATIGDYAIATTQEQIDQLIIYLNTIKADMPKK
jgi:hypothetical protein